MGKYDFEVKHEFSLGERTFSIGSKIRAKKAGENFDYVHIPTKTDQVSVFTDGELVKEPLAAQFYQNTNSRFAELESYVWGIMREAKGELYVVPVYPEKDAR